MACAVVDLVKGKAFDKKFEAGAVKAARRVAEAAVKAQFALEVPKDKQVRYWAVDLDVVVALDSKKQELQAGCGVIVNIKQDGKKFLHASKPPNSAKGTVNAAKLVQADIDAMVADAVSAAMEKPVALMKTGSKNL